MDQPTQRPHRYHGDAGGLTALPGWHRAPTIDY